jgi:hypothetical protein
MIYAMLALKIEIWGIMSVVGVCLDDIQQIKLGYIIDRGTIDGLI